MPQSDNITLSEFDKSLLRLVQIADECETTYDAGGRAAAKALVCQSTSIQQIRQGLCANVKLVRRKSLYLLTLIAPQTIIADLRLVLMNDSCPVVRHEAAFFLGTLRAKGAIEPLIQALTFDPNDLVRHEAAEALGDLGIADALPILESVSKSASSDAVRLTAEIALFQLSQAQSRE